MIPTAGGLELPAAAEYRQAVSRLRFDVEASRGRLHPQPEHAYRDAFQRDRDRIIHARAFRRLQFKTQVFAVPTTDHARNRLTHTLEVAQISRTVAAALGLNETLAEALALAHDIGHAPFGHTGEEVLNRRMAAYGEEFDHNIQALRIVGKFERRYAAFPGLNLTFEVREGLIKHSRDYDERSYPYLAPYRLDERPPLEAQLIDLCDEIAYNCADLDDALAVGILAPETASAAVGWFGEELGQARLRYREVAPELQIQEALRGLLGRLAEGVIVGTAAAALEAGAETADDVRRFPARLARFTEGARRASVQLRTLLRRHVYEEPALVEILDGFARMVDEVFGYLLKHPDAVPQVREHRVGDDPLERAVCDYIAGMTDGFVVERHREWVK